MLSVGKICTLNKFMQTGNFMSQNTSQQKFETGPGEAAFPRYLVAAAGSATLGLAIGKAISSAIAIKNPEVVQAINAASVALLCFIGTYCTEPKVRVLHPVKRGLASLAFAATMSMAVAAGDGAEKRFQEERAAMPVIDAQTVIGTKTVTIADQYCLPRNRGLETVVEHEGKKMLTLCPR